MSDHSLWGWTSLLSVYLAALIWPINQAVLAVADARLSRLIIHAVVVIVLTIVFFISAHVYAQSLMPPKTYEYCPHSQTGEQGPVPACQPYHL